MAKKLKQQKEISYKDWEEAEHQAVQATIMDIKMSFGMNKLVYDFGKNYRDAIDFVSLCLPSLKITTPKGDLNVTVEQVAFPKKTWWDKHMCGQDNSRITIAYQLKAEMDSQSEHDELYKWDTVNGIENVVDAIASLCFALRCWGEEFYHYIELEGY